MKHQQLENVIGKLKELGRVKERKLWTAIGVELEKATRKRRIVNLFKINKVTKENDVIIVPGKVLASGELNHKLTIAAHSFSQTALEKINKAQAKAVSIEKLMEINPDGQKIKIIG